VEGLLHWVNQTFPIAMTAEGGAFETASADEIGRLVLEKVQAAYDLKCEHEDPESIQQMERYIFLNAIDRLWQEHLYSMDALREGVYLRAYGQKDPLIEFKTEAFDIFSDLMANIKSEVLHNLFRSTSNLMAFEQFLASLPQFLESSNESGEVTHSRVEPEASAAARPAPEESALDRLLERQAATQPRQVGRNDPCPCGSGRKFKACCGKGSV
jgi:preprotein translocase subunit SecA